MSECLFRVNFVSRTSIVVKAETGMAAEMAALHRIAIYGDWEVESSEIVEECSKGFLGPKRGNATVKPD